MLKELKTFVNEKKGSNGLINFTSTTEYKDFIEEFWNKYKDILGKKSYCVNMTWFYYKNGKKACTVSLQSEIK